MSSQQSRDAGAGVGLAPSARPADPYRILFQEAPEPLLLRDEGGRILDANEPCAALLGVRREDMIGRGVGEFLEVGAVVGGARRSRIATTRLTLSEARARHAAGRSFPAELTTVPVEVDGRRAAFVRIVDTGPRRRVEQTLEELAALVGLAQGSADPAEVARRALAVLGRGFGSDAEVFGVFEGDRFEVSAYRGLPRRTVAALAARRPQDTPIGRRVLAEPGPQDLDLGSSGQVSEALRAILLAAGLRHEWVIPIRLGEHRIGVVGLLWREAPADPFDPGRLDLFGRAIGLALDNAGMRDRIEADVVERSRLEDSARVAALIVDQIDEAIVVTGAERRVTAFNPAAERQYGLSAEAAIGQRFEDLIDSTDLDGRLFDDRAYETIRREGVFRARVLHRPRSGDRAGRQLVIDLTLVPIRDEGGVEVGVLGVNRDVSASARLEAELATLAGLATATGQARDRRDIGGAALERLCEALAADGGLIFTYDGDEQSIAAAVAVPPEIVAAIEATAASDSPLLSRLVEAGGLAFVDIETAPLTEPVRVLAGGLGFSLVLFVALEIGGAVTGILALAWYDAPSPRPGEALIRQAGANLATSLESARLFRALEARMETERRLMTRLEALVELTRLPEQDAAGEPFLRALVSRAVELVGARAAFLGGPVGDRFEVHESVDLNEELLDFVANASPDDLWFWRELQTGGHAFLRGLVPGEANPLILPIAGRLGLRSYAALPIVDEGRVVAALVLHFEEPLEEVALDARTLEAIGRVVTIAVANAGLGERLAAAVLREQRVSAELQALQDLTLLSDERDDLPALATATGRRIMQAAGAAGAAYMLLDETADRLRTVWASGVALGPQTRLESEPASERTVVRRLREGEAYLLRYDDPSVRPRTAAYARAEGLQAYAALPLRVDGRLVGLIRLEWRELPEAGDRTAALLAPMARTASISLANFRLRQELLERAETERSVTRRLAALDELTRLGAEATDFAALAERTASLVREALGAGGVVYGTLRDGGEAYDITASAGRVAEYLPWLANLRPIDVPAVQRILAGSGGVLADYGGTMSTVEGQALGRRVGYRSFAVVPIRFRGELFGILTCLFEPPRDELAIDEVALDSVARVAGISLANFRLRTELEARAAAQEALAGRLAALDELTLIGEQAGSFDELAARTARLVRAALGARAVVYGEMTPDDRYEVQGIDGELGPFADFLAGLRPRRSPGVQAMLAGARSVLADYEPGRAMPEGLEAAAASGVRAYALIPVRVSDELVGQIFCIFDEPIAALPFDADDLDSVARVAGISLSNFRLRDRLVSSEERYRTLFEESPDALLLYGLDGRLLDCNEAGARLLGGPREAVLGRLAVELSGVPVEEFQRRWDAVLAGGRGSFRGLARRLDGTTVPVDVEVRVVHIADRVRLLVLERDVSDQERLQQELLQAQKMEALGQLVSGVAHELNNPLAAVVGFSRLIETDPRLPVDMRHDAGLLSQEAERTRRIVSNLLDFARQRPPERRPTDLATLVRSVLDLQAYALDAARATVELDFPADLPPVDVDRAQLQQVLLNLVLNAGQAIAGSGQPGRILVAARSSGGERDAAATPAVVRLEVCDDGPGVAPDVADRIFLPFFTTKEPGKGTGLGLSVSFGIVSAHGGRLWHEPGPSGRGARFVMELPIEAPARAAVDVERAGGPVAGGAADEVRPGRRSSGTPADQRAPTDGPRGRDRESLPVILVLDDESSIRQLLARTLAFAEVLPNASGEEALALLRERTVDLMLVDHRMPGLSGTDFYEAAVAIRPDLAGRTIFMSGDVLNPELQGFAERHGITLLAKPFNVADVAHLVLDVLDGGTAGAG
ncbi:MAG TPA: PAS domain S-box protein [Candidatus Limnocylindrales bacterium]